MLFCFFLFSFLSKCYSGINCNELVVLLIQRWKHSSWNCWSYKGQKWTDRNHSTLPSGHLMREWPLYMKVDKGFFVLSWGVTISVSNGSDGSRFRHDILAAFYETPVDSGKHLSKMVDRDRVKRMLQARNLYSAFSIRMKQRRQKHGEFFTVCSKIPGCLWNYSFYFSFFLFLLLLQSLSSSNIFCPHLQSFFLFILLIDGPVGWGWRIHRLYLFRRVSLSQWVSWICH